MRYFSADKKCFEKVKKYYPDEMSSKLALQNLKQENQNVSGI
jgi:hypothetical protein